MPLDSFIYDAATAFAAGVGLVCLTVGPLFRSRTSILAAQLAASIGFTAHYGLLGIAAASLVGVLGSIQTGAALFSARSEVLNKIGYALIPIMVAAGVHFWVGPVSALCVTAQALIALGRMQHNQWALRVLILLGGVFWSLHDFFIASWIAMTADLLGVAMGAAVLARMMSAHAGARRSLARDRAGPVHG